MITGDCGLTVAILLFLAVLSSPFRRIYREIYTFQQCDDNMWTISCPNCCYSITCHMEDHVVTHHWGRAHLAFVHSAVPRLHNHYHHHHHILLSLTWTWSILRRLSSDMSLCMGLNLMSKVINPIASRCLSDCRRLSDCWCLLDCRIQMTVLWSEWSNTGRFRDSHKVTVIGGQA